LYDDNGLHYICQTYDRFYAVNNVLNSMVESIKEQPCIRLLKHIIRCYIRLTEHSRAKEIIKKELPIVLREYNNYQFLTKDESILRLLESLTVNLNAGAI
jgi:CCR4-NOT transcription complex subunit 9